MTDGDEDVGLVSARRLAAIAQNGLTFSTDAFDVLRYREVRAIAVELLAARSSQSPAALLAVLDREQGYATPKVDVRGVAFRDDGTVLLVQEREDQRWTLPGGWADPTDQPSQAVEREVREEAGFLVRAHRLLACWDRSLQAGAPAYPFRVYKLFFAVELLAETQREHTETLDVGWFPLDALPPLSLGRATAPQLVRLAELYGDPSRPASFD